jgi:hypothetical protein
LWKGENAPLGSNDIQTVDNNSWVTFGHSTLRQQVEEYPPSGQLALQRVLYALEFVLGIEYSPIIPTLATIFLGMMSESYVFTALREMAHHTTWYFPCNLPEHVAHGRAFLDVLSKLHPQSSTMLRDLGVSERFTQAIFQDLFVPLLPEEYVLRIVDIYTFEGSKVLFRFGVALVVLLLKEWNTETAVNSPANSETASAPAVTPADGEDCWKCLQEWTHSERFDFELLVRRSYGLHKRGVRKR